LTQRPPLTGYRCPLSNGIDTAVPFLPLRSDGGLSRRYIHPPQFHRIAVTHGQHVAGSAELQECQGGSCLGMAAQVARWSHPTVSPTCRPPRPGFCCLASRPPESRRQRTGGRGGRPGLLLFASLKSSDFLKEFNIQGPARTLKGLFLIVGHVPEPDGPVRT